MVHNDDIRENGIFMLVVKIQSKPIGRRKILELLIITTNLLHLSCKTPKRVYYTGKYGCTQFLDSRKTTTMMDDDDDVVIKFLILPEYQVRNLDEPLTRWWTHQHLLFIFESSAHLLHVLLCDYKIYSVEYRDRYLVGYSCEKNTCFA